MREQDAQFDVAISFTNARGNEHRLARFCGSDEIHVFVRRLVVLTEVEGQTQILGRISEQHVELPGQCLQVSQLGFGWLTNYFGRKQNGGGLFGRRPGSFGLRGIGSCDGGLCKACRRQREDERTETESNQNITVPLANTSNVLLSLTTKRRPMALMTGR